MQTEDLLLCKDLAECLLKDGTGLVAEALDPYSRFLIAAAVAARQPNSEDET
jgi:hypothetical protein